MLVLTGFKANTLSVKMVSGTVTAQSDGQPLAGVAVYANVNKRGTVTDKSGRYSLTLELAEKSLRFSAVGYKTVTTEIKNKELNIVLEQVNNTLNEVVVVGYGTARKSTTTYSSTYMPPASAKAGALEGRIAGVAISSTDSKSITSKLKGRDKSLDITSAPASKNELPQSNQLTAGEWNDLAHWNFWKDLMNNQEWSAQQSRWEFYTNKRLSIQLQNNQLEPLNNYAVTVFNNDNILWKAQTNFEGKAEFWTSFYNNEQAFYNNEPERLTVVVNAPDGKQLYKKEIQPKLSKLNIRLNRTAEKIKNLDVMFMVDATGSMGDEINYLKSELEDIIGRLNNDANLNTRTALVFYRDHGDEYLVRDFGFDHNLTQVKQNLSSQNASGGGDFEEAVEEAMENAIHKQQWTTAPASAKIMFMILDAPPHHTVEKIKSLQKSVKEAAEKGIILIPVVASGIDKNTEFLMRFMAMGTNGTYVFLTDDSGIGNSHLKPTTGNYEVEHLNSLLNRLIRKYSGLVVKI